MRAEIKSAGEASGAAAVSLQASQPRPLPLSATRQSNAVPLEVQAKSGGGSPDPSPLPEHEQQQQHAHGLFYAHHHHSQQMGEGKENAQPRNAAMMGLRDKMVEQIAAFQKRGRSRSPPVAVYHHHQQQQQQQQQQPADKSSSNISTNSSMLEHRPLPEVPRDDEIALLKRERDAMAADAEALSAAVRGYKEERARLVFDLDASHARAEQLKRDKEATLEALRNRTRQAEEIADALEHCRGERDAALRAVADAPKSAELAAILDECRREVGEARRRESKALSDTEVARCERDKAHRRIEELLKERDALARALSSTCSRSPLPSPAAASALAASAATCSTGSPCPSSGGEEAAAASPRLLAWSLSPASSRGRSESPSPSMFAGGEEEQQHGQGLLQGDQPKPMAVTVHAGGGIGGWVSRHAHAHGTMLLSPVPEERIREGTSGSDVSISSRVSGVDTTPARRAIAFVSRMAAALFSRKVPSNRAVLLAWHHQARACTGGRRRALAMAQRSEVGVLQAGWGVWRCRALTMMDARREVSSAKGKVQGADARVRVYQGAIVLAAERRERDAIRRRVMQVMSANAYWRGASREAARRLCEIAARVGSLAAMVTWRRIASERRISVRKVARALRAWRGRTLASNMRRSLEFVAGRAALAAWRSRVSACLAVSRFHQMVQCRCDANAKAAAMRAWRVEVEVVSLRISACLRRSIAAWDGAVCMRGCLQSEDDAAKFLACWRRAANARAACCAFGRWRLEAGRGKGRRRERELEEREGERKELEGKLRSAEGALILLLDSGLAIGPAKQHSRLHAQPSQAIM